MSGQNQGGGPLEKVRAILTILGELAVLYIAWVYAGQYSEDHGGSIIPKIGARDSGE